MDALAFCNKEKLSSFLFCIRKREPLQPWLLADYRPCSLVRSLLRGFSLQVTTFSSLTLVNPPKEERVRWEFTSETDDCLVLSFLALNGAGVDDERLV